MRKTTAATTTIASALFLLLAGGSVHAEDKEKPDFSEVSGGEDKVSVEDAVDAGVPESVAKREDIDDDGKLTEKDWEYVTMEERSAPEQPEGENGGSMEPEGQSEGDGGLEGQPEGGQDQSGGGQDQGGF